MKRELLVCSINTTLVLVVYGYYCKNPTKKRTGRFFSFPCGPHRKKHNTSLARGYCVPWQYIGFLTVDEIRLLYLTVPLRKVPRRNRTMASSTDVEKLSLKHGIHPPKVHFSSTSATQQKFSGRPPKWLVVLRDIRISVALSTKTQIFTQNFKCFDGIYCSIAVLPLVPTRVSSTQMFCWNW